MVRHVDGNDELTEVPLAIRIEFLDGAARGRQRRTDWSS